MNPTIVNAGNAPAVTFADPAGAADEGQGGAAAPGVQSQPEAVSLLSMQGQPENDSADARLTLAPALHATSAEVGNEVDASADAPVRDLAWYRKQAERGDAQAQFELGDAYFRSSMTLEGMDEALEWTSKAAEQGEGLDEAFEWTSKAAEQGHADAQHRLGWMYYEGQGAKKDRGQAFEWYRQAAQQGHRESQFELGSMYYNGKGVQQDMKRAFEWLGKAAQQGNMFAHDLLCEMYREGIHVKQDHKQAMWHLMTGLGWGKPGESDLNLANQKIDDDLVGGLVSILQNDQTIEKLNLANNRITDAGATKLAQMLEQNATLRELRLENNPIGQPGWTAIGDAMRSNTTLKKVFFTLDYAIEREGEINERIGDLLSEQQKWQASADSSSLPSELTSLLEQTLIRTDIKLLDSTSEATMQRLLELQLCLSRV